LHRKESRVVKSLTNLSYTMSSRPTALYPERAAPVGGRDPVITPISGQADSTHGNLGALASPLAGVAVDAMQPEEHLLALREGVDYLAGVLQLVDSYLHHVKPAEPISGIAAVTNEAAARTLVLQRHLDALTEDHLQRMRDTRSR
jgi:hypothetical protein